MASTLKHQNLKSLCINSPFSYRGESFWKSLLAVLETMPHLEALELSDCFTSDVDSIVRDGDSVNIVALPHLRFVKFSDDKAVSANLLILLSIPSDCSVWVRARAMNFGNPGVQHYLANFNGDYSTQRMVVGRNYVQLRPTSSNGNVTPSYSSDELPTHRVGPEFIVEATIMDAFIRNPSPHAFSQVVNLTVFCNSKTEAEPFIALFGLIPTVQILHIHGAPHGQDILTQKILDVPGAVVAQLDHNEGVVLETSTRSPSTLLSAAPLPQLRELSIGLFPNEAAAKHMMSCLVTRRSYGLGPDMVKIRLSEAISAPHPDSTMTRKELERLFVEEFGWTDWGCYITFE